MITGFIKAHTYLFGYQALQACHFTLSGALILACPRLVGYLLLLELDALQKEEAGMKQLPLKLLA